MKLSNKTYDIIKWVALVLIPATCTLWLTVGKVWAFPYLTEIGATISAVGLFLAAIIGISNDKYKKEIELYGQALAVDEDGSWILDEPEDIVEEEENVDSKEA